MSGHPKNNLMLEETFLTIEKQHKHNDSWSIIATDGDWETKFSWLRTNMILGQSIVKISWDIPPDMEEGFYRIRHFGFYRTIIQKIKPYSGVSSIFKVTK